MLSSRPGKSTVVESKGKNSLVVRPVTRLGMAFFRPSLVIRQGGVIVLWQASQSPCRQVHSQRTAWGVSSPLSTGAARGAKKEEGKEEKGRARQVLCCHIDPTNRSVLRGREGGCGLPAH
jgi:hypothetical protein